MTITITINGIERTYQGDYDELHNIEWNDKVREMIDSVNDNTVCES